MRKTLYFKDDDSRLSFLKGNFITLTNLSEEDLMKIIRLRISPINVSVHTTNPELRVEMLKNPKAKDVMKDLKRLTDNGITVNGQIVLCPGYNDGDELKETIEALYSLGPQFKSLAVVPVGLTQYRDGLVALTPVDRAKAKETIEIIEHYQQRFLADRGTRFVFAADEFYLKADQAIPVLEAYEDFPQIENGVGLIRQFNTQVLNHIGKIDAEFQGTITLVTGVSAADNLRDLSRKIMENYDNLTIEVIPIENDFFGEKITVAGLLTGQDLMNQLKDRPLGDKVLIPEVMLKDGETIFLDDVTVKTLAQTINREVLVTKVNGKDFLERILKR
jgi:putative radical SAM enzyme (TIGR03279 family)